MITFLSPVEIIATNDFSEKSCNSFDIQLISNSWYMIDTCIMSILFHIMVLIAWNRLSDARWRSFLYMKMRRFSKAVQSCISNCGMSICYTTTILNLIY